MYADRAEAFRARVPRTVRRHSHLVVPTFVAIGRRAGQVGTAVPTGTGAWTGAVHATTIAAACELARRLQSEPAGPEAPVFRSPSDVVARFGPLLRDLRHEEFWVVLLTTSNQPLRELRVTSGTLNSSLVHPRECFAEAIKLGDRIAIMKDGAFDQVGTATDLITEPATDYVSEFTKEIPKAKVLTTAAVLKEGEGEPNGRIVGIDDTIEAVLPALLDDESDIWVEDTEGKKLGIVDRQAVSRALAPDR